MTSSTESPLVSVIIPTRDRREMLDDCLRTVVANDYPAFEVMVIDNASTDGTSDLIREKYPDVEILRNEQNVFLADARNAGMRRAKGDYFLFIDDDNEVEPDMISELVALCRTDPSIGSVGPKMYYYGTDRLLIWTGARIDLVSSRTMYRGADVPDVGQYEEPAETEHIPNVVMMTRAMYEKVGGYDEIYQMSYADSDLPMRGIRAGFKVVYCPKAVTWHKVPPPSGRRNPFKIPMRAYFFSRNRFIYMKRFASRGQFLAFAAVFAPLFTLHYAWVTARLGDWQGFSLHLAGTAHGVVFGLTNRISNLPKRIRG